LALFYGIINKKKFKFIKNLTFLAIKLNTFALIKLECTLATLLFRTNLFTNMYTILNFIKLGGCLVNNKIITYPFRILSIGDTISINNKYFKKILNSFFIKANITFITSHKHERKFINRPIILLNVPKYIYFNYKILHFKLIRLPFKNEFISPIHYPFDNKGMD